MRFPIPFLGLTAQLPLGPAMSEIPAPPPASPLKEFAFKEGPDTFSPNDLVGGSARREWSFINPSPQVSLGRPGSAIPNRPGDLALVSFSKFDLEEKKSVRAFFYAFPWTHDSLIGITSRSSWSLWSLTSNRCKFQYVARLFEVLNRRTLPST